MQKNQIVKQYFPHTSHTFSMKK